MANFLDDLSVWNAKASAAIAEAAAAGNTDKANMMSSLKTTANDTTLTEAVRLNALTALINLGGLLDVPLPPYFPLTVTYANTQTYIGIHDDLTGLQGGAPGDYQHLTTAERNSILSKASFSDITFANLLGSYSDNVGLAAVIDGKQTELNGVGFVKINGNQSTITYDNSTYLTSVTLAATALSGELSGTIGNPTVNNAAVISKVLTGWNGSATYTAITASDTILSGMQKLNARISSVIANPGGVSSITASTNAPTILNVAASSPTGAVTFSVDFDSQTQNKFLASPSGSSGAPSFRAIVVADLPNSGATAGTYGSAALIPQIIVDAKGRITSISNVTANSGGLVNAVSLTGPAIFDSYSSTGGATPQLSFGLTDQTANTIWAGPASGANADPQFRALVDDDIPNIPTTKVNGLDNLLANKLDAQLNSGEIWIGNNSNAPTNRSLTQDIEMTNTGVVTIQPNVVDFSKMQEITGYDSITGQPGNLLGRYAAGLGNVQEVNLNPLHFSLDDTTGTLSLATPPTPILNTKGGLITYRQSIGQAVQLSAVFDGNLLITDSAEDDGLKWVTAQGDVEVDPALDGTLNITANAVTLAKMATLPAFTVIGNDTSGSLTPKALTKTELTTLINQFTSSAMGVVPATGGVGSTYYLDATGAWSVPAGGGGGTPGGSAWQFQYNDSGTAFAGSPNIVTDASNNILVTSGSFGIVDNAMSPNYGVYVTAPNVAVSGLTWAIPTYTDSDIFVGEAFTQILTNKTLSTGSKIDIGATSAQYDMWYSSDSAGTIATIAGGAGNVGKYLKYTASGPAWEGVTATSATNIDGGTANQIPYQTAPSTTSFIAAPTTANTYLKWDGSTISWQSAGSGSGTVNAGAQYALAYYPNASGGTVVDDVTISTTNGTNFLTQVISGGAASAMPAWVVAQTAINTLAGATTSGQYLRGNGSNVVMSAIQAGDVPTLNQSTTGTAANITATSNSTLTTLSSLSLPGSQVSGNILGNAANVTGTVAVANGGTNGTATPTAGAIAYGTGTAYAFSAAGTVGQYLTSGGSGVPVWVNAPAATLTVGTSVISSGTIGRVLFQGTSNFLQQSANLFWDNTNGRLAIGGSSAPSGLFQVAAGTASVPQLILTPTTATPTGTTAGSMWYYESGGTEYLALYKTTAATQTKIITKDRNPDFATGTTSGVVVSDSSGTLSKSADLTALGILATYSTYTVTTTATNIFSTVSFTGTTNLPANFFGVGKTIVVVVYGQYTSTSGSPTLPLTLAFGTYSQAFTVNLHGGVATASLWRAEFIITCSASGASGALRTMAQSVSLDDTANGTPKFSKVLIQTASSFNTTSASTISLSASYVSSATTATIDMCQIYYLN